MTAEKEQILSTLLQNHISDDEPGAQYIVVDKNKILYEKNIGLEDINESIPLNSSHTMAAFSMTKVLTAILSEIAISLTCYLNGFLSFLSITRSEMHHAHVVMGSCG